MLFRSMGAVILTMTGGEAIYADMGHFGRLPIRLAWFIIVLPCLLLNYAGQGALLLRSPDALANPFYMLIPNWALYPMIGLATAAAVIASQAVITGVFSMVNQAIQLRYLPRLTVKHTSELERGQIYLPFINWMLFISVVILILLFENSANLASAYGVAVTMTMLCGTIFGVPVRKIASPGTNLVPSPIDTLLIKSSIGNASFSIRLRTNARPSFQVIKMVNSTAPNIIGTHPPDRIFNEVEATNIKSRIKNGAANSSTFQIGQRQKP